MIKLYSVNNKVLSPLELNNPIIGCITTNHDLPLASRKDKILLLKHTPIIFPIGFLMVIIKSSEQLINFNQSCNVIELDPELNYLDNKDIIKFNPTKKSIHVMYRFNANTNSFLVTERCNSFCIMCSQPPRDIDDGYIVNEILQALPLIDSRTREIGFTGGEATLLGPQLLELISACKRHIPETALHILSNGRNFQNLEFAKNVAYIQHPDLMWGIPLYSDTSQIHDFVVQRKGAFNETLLGILNLKKCQQKVEIRIVLHKQTYKRLPQLAEFICRNLLFVDHVALMGLEIMGFTKANLSELWIDPFDYQNELVKAVEILDHAGIRTSIYNHQLCLLPDAIRPFAVKSISDWKNEYKPQCDPCKLKNECGGFFSSSTTIYSQHIQAIS